MKKKHKTNKKQKTNKKFLKNRKRFTLKKNKLGKGENVLDKKEIASEKALAVKLIMQKLKSFGLYQPEIAEKITKNLEKEIFGRRITNSYRNYVSKLAHEIADKKIHDAKREENKENTVEWMTNHRLALREDVIKLKADIEKKKNKLDEEILGLKRLENTTGRLRGDTEKIKKSRITKSLEIEDLKSELKELYKKYNFYENLNLDFINDVL